MKRKYILLLTVLIIGLVANSCKKDGSTQIQTLLPGGTWLLTSVIATNYTGNTQNSIDTLNVNTDKTPCGLSQHFTFNADHTCTYTNYSCTMQTVSGTWALTANQLFLQTTLVCTSDTAKVVKPFTNAAIINLGQYSMVINTGDIQPNYSLTAKRRVVQYGFIRETQISGN